MALLKLVAWSLGGALLYYVGARYYGMAILWLADVWVDLFLPLSLQIHPQGIVATSRYARFPMGIPIDLYVVGLNVIFAPALVLTTLGVNRGALVKAVLAVLILMLLQSIELLALILFHLVHPENTAIPLQVAPGVAATIEWIHVFLDRMGYALYPFLAWMILCPGVLSRLLRARRPESAPTGVKGGPESPASVAEAGVVGPAAHAVTAPASAEVASRLLARVPRPPARLLLVGLEPANLPGLTAAAGYDLTVMPRTADLTAPPEQAGATDPLPPAAMPGAVGDAGAPPGYDAIISHDALAGRDDLGAWLAAARERLAPGGQLILCEAVSHTPAPASALDAHLPRALAPDRRPCHPPRLIEQALAACGLVVEQHEAWSSAPPAASQPAVCTDRELWVLAPGDLCIRGYRPGDEQRILPAFNQVFYTHRTDAHWRWKYLDNPYGRAWISAAWDGEHLAAHYAGYPVPLYFEQAVHPSCHAGDVFSVPAYRKLGHGSTALMSRVFRHWERSYCEDHLPFAFGFNVNKPQKLGRWFWRHQVPAPVYQRRLEASAVARWRARWSWRLPWRGYRLVTTERVGDWADPVFAAARDDYGWLVARNRTYLTWRYQQCPDMRPTFLVVYRGRRPVGWLLGRLQDGVWQIGDALFERRHAAGALRAALIGYLRQHPEIQGVDSWFSESPLWWNRILDRLGFVKQRQFQALDLVVRFYQAKLSPETVAERFYFTWGDSDLY